MAIANAVQLEMRAVKAAQGRIDLDLTTSMVKIAAPMGVPKTAAKTPLMPARAIVLRLLSSSLKTLEKRAAIPPPILRAAPSRPAEPPKK